MDGRRGIEREGTRFTGKIGWHGRFTPGNEIFRDFLSFFFPFNGNFREISHHFFPFFFWLTFW